MRKIICGCTRAYARTRVWVHRIHSSGGGGVSIRVGRREVGDGTRDTSLGRERKGQREWGTHGFPSFLLDSPFVGHSLFSSLRVSDVSLVLSFSPFSPPVSASHSRIVYAPPSLSITRYFGFSLFPPLTCIFETSQYASRYTGIDTLYAGQKLDTNDTIIMNI